MKKAQQEYIINIEENKAFIINLMSKVTDILESKNIEYWIEYGTLLGAVREKGFIPWDSEIDMGIWYDTFVTHKTYLFEEFKKLGFTINLSSTDRVKLVHKDLTIGAYTIDIHTYHIKDDVAYVSFNKKVKTPLYNLYFYLSKTVQMYDDRKKVVYTMAPLIRLIMAHKTNIPETFTFVKGKYLSNKSFRLIIDGDVLSNDKKYLNKIRFTGRLGLNIVGLLHKLISKIYFNRLADFFKKKVKEKTRTTDTKQVIPLHYFNNLSYIKFETIEVSCPAKYEEYVESVYGPTWHIGKPQWARSENKINKALE